MDWQLPNIGKTITNNILPSILSAHTVSILRFHLVSIGRFRQCSDSLKSVVSVKFYIWPKAWKSVNNVTPLYIKLHLCFR